MAKYVEKNTKKREKEKVLKMANFRACTRKNVHAAHNLFSLIAQSQYHCGVADSEMVQLRRNAV